MKPAGILIYYHCRSNTGYAIGRHEPDFFKMAQVLTGDINKIHVGYTSLDGGFPWYLDGNFRNVITFDSGDSSEERLDYIYNYIKENNIDIAFGFDQPVSSPAYEVMRKSGIKLMVSYWGASMSSINTGLKLLFKRLEVKMRKYKPDHYIFQSQAMADTAVYGRGIDQQHVSVIHNAVDTNVFKPDESFLKYAHQQFNIPDNRKLVFYSGHMEERKGVHVILKAASELIQNRKRNDVHFLILGNVNGEEKRFAPLYAGTETENYVTFGGYRNDVAQLHRSCYMGVIATTGWDSFTMSSMEMASSGLPLVVSNLQGLVETVENGVSGYLNEPGDYVGLADKIETILDNPVLQNQMGTAGRLRVIERFSLDKHIEALVGTVQNLYAEKAKYNRR